MDLSDLSKEELLERLETFEERITELEADQERLQEENERLREENERLRTKLDKRDEKIEKLEKRLAFYENPHTPSSKQRSPTGGSATDDHGEDTDEDDVRTDGGTGGRTHGHDPAFRTPRDPDSIIEVTQDACPCCGDPLGAAERVTARLIEEIPEPAPIEVTQYNRHHYRCNGCGEETVASDPNCPEEGQFGVNVLAEAALSRYEYRLPYRKIADRFDQLHDLEMSGASAWHATERAARAGRDEYEEIREAMRAAEVVHVDETGMQLDGEQAWIWTFRSETQILFAVRDSRGSDVPREVLGEDFAGTIVCDGWTAYPAFHDELQRCWAHILREAKAVAADHADAEPISRRLHRLYDGLQRWLETDPSSEQRRQMAELAQDHLDHVVEMDVEPAAVKSLQTKIEGGLDHWLTFVGEPAVAPTNNAAENALREPVVLRKIIGTLRNATGVFVHETLLSLLATWSQQGLNPYEELKRVVRDW